MFICSQVVKDLFWILEDQRFHWVDDVVDENHFLAVVYMLAAFEVDEGECVFQNLKRFLKIWFIFQASNFYFLKENWNSLEYYQNQAKKGLGYISIFFIEFICLYFPWWEKYHFQKFSG